MFKVTSLSGFGGGSVPAAAATIAAATGTFTLGGVAATLRHVHSYTITASTGSVALAGNAVTLTRSGGDPYFANVVFLAGWEGSDGATSYTEEKNSAVGTFVGNAQLDSAQKKFGSTSVLFDGSGDRVTFPSSNDWDLANSNSDPYTIEGWVRFNVLDTNNRGILSRNNGASATGFIISATSAGTEFGYTFSSDGSAFQTVGTTGASLTTGVWYAWCIDHDATGKIRVYINGVMLGSSTPANSTMHNPNALLTVGAQDQSGLVDMNGWVDEIRITKGVARYASDSGYTVSTTAFPRF